MVRKTILSMFRAFVLLLPVIAWLISDTGIASGWKLATLVLGAVLTYCMAETEAMVHGWVYSLMIACEGVLVSFFSAKHECEVLYTHFVLCVTFIQLAIFAFHSAKGEEKKE